ncbi:hypothetical protein EV586_10331 [Tumebacillus sp. BK434]|uniref:hypothetical protein n=1 Tax=Tumebacillus sp. BK434 TaxID=2512169 RepID=UPI00104F7559|nr:hypothetical protein [Tumebacillus sp. BK434]TCP55379.1 hypothetical protein EV586_10331 [Tumebacillus sp. BK434]
MKVSLPRLRPLQWFLLLAILVAGVDYAALQVAAHYPSEQEAVALGVAFDLILTIPLLYYFLVIRKSKQSWLAVLPVFFFGTLAGKYMLPASQSEWFDRLIYVAPVLEAGLVLFVLFKLRTLVKQYRALRATAFHWIDAFRSALASSIGESRLVDLLAMDVGMLSYALNFSKPKPQRFPAFTYHQDSSLKALVIVFSLLLLLESTLTHMLIAVWSDIVAWIATASSLYTILILIAYYNSVKHSPILVSRDQVYVRIGFASHVLIDKANIAGVQRLGVSYEEKRDKHAFYAVLLMEEPQLEIKLHQPVILHGPLGRQTPVGRVLLKVDDPHRFISALEQGEGA